VRVWHGLISCIVFDPEMAIRRKVVLTILARVTVLSILVMWTCLPLYWGSCELEPLPKQTKTDEDSQYGRPSITPTSSPSASSTVTAGRSDSRSPPA
jgi:hypothetical protein